MQHFTMQKPFTWATKKSQGRWKAENPRKKEKEDF